MLTVTDRSTENYAGIIYLSNDAAVTVSSPFSPPFLQALKTVRYSGLMPYVVFIASPQLERLHITRKVGSEKQKKRLVPASSQADLDDAQVYTVSWR